ncbi:protein S40-6-like [Curcuma longa]|uniref:protein S40-6-like n=1 Tax=Curcuma longa TaxID=136217 RepID=UPI003D9F505C
MGKGRVHGAAPMLPMPAAPALSGDVMDDLPDLEEGDVWPELQDASGDHIESADADADDGRRPPARRMGRRRSRRWGRRYVGGLTLALEDGRTGTSPAASHPSQQREGHRVAASAPVDVPVWPRWLQSGSPAEREAEEEEEEEDSGDGEWLPPHEYLARARRRSVATSVLEGVGRTLKGRDMRRVRDAVWSQTGFFG